MSRPKIVFLATEDWFVGSHFRPLLQRAVADGFEVVVAARNSGTFAEDRSVRVAPMPFARRGIAPGDIGGETRAVRALLRAEQPQLIHAIALKPIALALMADTAGATRKVLALTGRGYLGARGGWRRIVLEMLALRMRAALARGNSVVLTENQADQNWVRAGAASLASRMLVMPGAGIDTESFVVTPEPSGPIVVGVVARLIRSKGVDLAVEAVRRLREDGTDIRLRIAGDIDRDNPERVDDRELSAWRAMLGVEVLGRIIDVNAFWAEAHIACLPSRGGEGLPRSLLEAAACGRALVTTNVPGCADFVVAGKTGLVVPANDIGALVGALRELVSDQALRQRFGAAARKRTQDSYTEQHAADVAARAWRLTLEGRSNL